MIARILRLVGAMLAAGMMATSPALAQSKYASDENKLTKAQRAEMNCVHEAIPDADLYVVVDVSLGLTSDDVDVEKAQGAVDKAAKACAARHKWEPGLTNIAVAIAVNTATVDVLTQGLSIKAQMDKIEAIFTTMKTLPEADLDMLAGGGASADADFRQKMNQMLIGIGLPDDKAVLRDGVTAMEAAATREAAIGRWIAARTG